MPIRAAMDLPATIPLFPLPNAVLFPGVPLPLHIFEPRYREMVRDAVESGPGLIGMVLLRGDWRECYHEAPDIYPLGCAGRLVRADLLEDGRYNILLQGVREFQIGSEVGDTSYRQAEVSWREAPVDHLSDEQRSTVRDLMTRVLGEDGGNARLRMLDDESLSDELFINFMSFALDIAPMEKQALLQAVAVRDRARRLCDILQFALGGTGSVGSEMVH